MKKADVEKKITKSIIITAIVLAVMFCMVLIEKGYKDIHFSYPYMNNIMLVSSIGLLLAAAVCVFLGFKKNQRFFEASAWCAGLATLSMLIKINHEAKVIISVATKAVNDRTHALIELNWAFGTITFYELAELGFFIYLIGLWIHTVYCVNKK